MMREFIIRSAKSMPEAELLRELKNAIKNYEDKPTPDSKRYLELFTYMLTLKFDKSSADELISELSQMERTRDFFTTNKN